MSDKRLNELKDSIPKIIGTRIKNLRKEKGLTQTELAELVGKDRQYLYKIEKGKVTPNIVTISALAIALEISLKNFFDF
ncbi:helix-turn-helix domain-containing protein [Seonamhaeicola sp. ML3]|uniref:helix-turn-helix domain-containing protein n=1 Tax=Seonamhaeicola sp. ML3 TaxID=2937786 RepID=UPI00200C612B|nr:helix-turn-helix transcriptional regulator [Seonamhaeicola sp. ML3]